MDDFPEIMAEQTEESSENIMSIGIVRQLKKL
jgi:hypothetical protein